jgi:hypothetical protein
LTIAFLCITQNSVISTVQKKERHLDRAEKIAPS